MHKTVLKNSTITYSKSLTEHTKRLYKCSNNRHNLHPSINIAGVSNQSMQQQLLDFFQQHPQWAIIISLGISVVVAIVGILPSVFVTAANILFFGFWEGVLLSFLGEALGAAVAFVLYRKGFRKGAGKKLHQFPKAATLVEAQGAQAFGLILSLRLLPFVPSGLVTLAAAIGKISVLLFVTASSLGKIPALLLEGWAVYGASKLSPVYQIALAVVAIIILYFVLFRKNSEGR